MSQWMDLEHLRKVVLKRKEAEDIHDLRVASRRMRATLELFAPFIHGRLVKRLTREIRMITREVGRLRNIDEALLYFGQDAALFPALQPRLAAAREGELKSMVKVLKPFPVDEMERMLRLAVADLSANPQQDTADSSLPVYLSKTAVNRFQAVYDLILPATDPEAAETRHALRIAIKKWRYLLEALSRIFDHDFQEALDLLKEYQTILGSLNDLTEFEALCGKMRLPADVHMKIGAMLAKDNAQQLARFLELASSRRPHYTFSI